MSDVDLHCRLLRPEAVTVALLQSSPRLDELVLPCTLHEASHAFQRRSIALHSHQHDSMIQ